MQEVIVFGLWYFTGMVAVIIIFWLDDAQKENDPLAVFRNMVVDPDGYKPAAPEGPLHPDGPLPDVVPGWEREKEEVE